MEGEKATNPNKRGFSQNDKQQGKKKRKFIPGYKSRAQQDEDRQSFHVNQRENRHPGSFPLEEILASEDYQMRHITQENSVKKKYVLCVSYLGTKYQGLQINANAHTIEQELEKALFYNGSIIEDNFGYLQKIQFTRAARTDRGVHALTQSLAMRLITPREVDLNLPQARDRFLEVLNQFLPSDIKVQGMMKVSKNFNAHSQCTKRIYHYLLPTYVLQSKELILALLQQKYEEQGPIKGAGYDGGYVDPNTSKSLTRDSLESLYENIATSFRLNAQQLQDFRTILRNYEGTKSYHNYTTGKDASEANAKRFMLSCTCEDPFVNPITQIEYVKVIFYGQSFLLNQIRKMLGMAIEVLRGQANLDDMNASFQANQKVEVPMVPALGLYLADIFFDGYNNRQRILQQKEEERLLRKDLPEDNNIVDVKEVTESNSSEKPNEGTDEKVGEEEDEEGEQQKNDNGKEQNEIEREQVYWYDDEDIKKRILHFQESVLYPHLFQQEKDSLAFMFYLDFLRAFPSRYPSHQNNNSTAPSKEIEPATKESVI